MFRLFLGVCTFGTWMYDVKNDKYDVYPTSLTWLNSLMLAFCVIDIFFLYAGRNSNPESMCPLWFNELSFVRSCIDLGLVVLVYLSS